MRIDAPQITLVVFPGPVPQLPIDPSDTGDEAFGFDGAKNRSGLGVDLMDLALPIFAHPKRALGPGKSGVAAAPGRLNRGEHAPGLGIDLLNTVLGDLEQMLTVERGARMPGHIERSQLLATLRIEGIQAVAGREPDVRAVERDAVDSFGLREGPVFADDISL